MNISKPRLRKLKVVAVLVIAFIGYMLYLLLSTRTIFTPVVALSELTSHIKEHCGKAVIVKGKVLEHIDENGYEIEQGGVRLIVGVGKDMGPLPPVGRDIEAHLFVACDEARGKVLFVLGPSFSESP